METPQPPPVETSAKVCEDCGKPTANKALMHRQVAGLFSVFCDDCLEEINLMDRIYVEPCHACRGHGTTWEGMDCEYCDGSGESDF